MRAPRAVAVAAVCAAIIAAGIAAAPDKLPSLDLVVPASDTSTSDGDGAGVPTP